MRNKEEVGMQMKKSDVKNIGKKQMFFIGLGIVVLIVMIVGISLYRNRKVTIDLNDYITVEYKGYDTAGTAMAYWDMDALEADYGDKIRLNEKEVEKYNEDHKRISNDNPFQSMIALCVVGGLDKNYDLTNGESINFIWYCDVELAEKLFYCNLKCEDKEYTVEGLEEVEQIDPFENLSVTYDGISPVGRVKDNCISTEGAYREIYYSITYPREDGNEKVKNGDEITVSASAQNAKELIKDYGVTLSPTEKTYTVEGLPEYVSSEGDLTEEVLAQLQTEVADKLTEKINAAIQKNDNVSSKITSSLSSVEYVGNYFMTAKDPVLEYESNSRQNYCRLIYLVTMHEELQLKSGETKTYDIAYYVAAEVNDIVIDSTGACTVADSKMLWGDTYEYKTDVKQGLFGIPVTFRFDGYESIENYCEKEQRDDQERYNIETTIQ